MSWFGTSLSYAKTAFNQAQKSIDKVLDISEEQGLVPELNNEATTAGVSVSPQPGKQSSITAATSQTQADTSSTPKSKQNLSSTKSHPPPPPPPSSSPASQSHSTAPPPRTPKVQSAQSSDPFNTTWGSSIWTSPTSPPVAEQQQQQQQRRDRRRGSSPRAAGRGGGRRKATKQTPLKPEGQTTGFEPPALTSTPVSGGTSNEEPEKTSLEHRASKRKKSADDLLNRSPETQLDNAPPAALLKPVYPTPEIEATDSSSVEPPTSPSSSSSSSPPIPAQPSRSEETQLNNPETSADPSHDGAFSTDTAQLATPLEYTTQVAAASPPSGQELVDPAQKTVDQDSGEVGSDSVPAPDTKAMETATESIAKEETSTQCAPDQLKTVTDELKAEDYSQPSPVSTPATTVSIPTQNDATVLPDSCEPQLLTASVGHLQQQTAPSSSQDEPQPSNSAPLLAPSEPPVSSEEVETLKKELLQVKEVLDARELKLVEMSRESISLMEENQSLKKELAETREAGESDVVDMREEFAHRLASSEKKLQAVIRERDSFRKQLQAIQNEQTQLAKSEGDEMSKLMKEKDEQISQLMEEGEKLSKQELQSNSIIKKLRLKERQNDQLLTAQRQQIHDFDNKIKSLKEQLKKREDNERKYQESLGQLNTIAEQQAKEVTKLKSERDELSDKVRSLQTNLDNVYKELAEAQKAKAVTQTAAEEATLNAQQSARGEFESKLEEQKLLAHREKEPLLMEIGELRASISRQEQQAAWREERMKQEVADVQQRLQEAEGRNQELTSTISQATKPLLRQIENLQAAHATQSANWDRVETSLTQRLVEAQSQLSASSEKERAAVEKELTARSKVKSLETQVSSLRQEKSQLLASIELERAKLETLEEGAQRDSAKMEAVRSSYQHSMEEIRKEKELLERQLEYERVRVEAESRKASLESQEKERLRLQLATSVSSLSRQSSTTASTPAAAQSQGDLLERSLLHSHEEGRGGSVSEGGVFGSSGRVGAGSASAFEHLQSLLKQKEGELANFQNLASSLERSRSAMAEDLASVSGKNEQLSVQVATISPLKEKLQDVQQHYEALLQMYGEKAEEAEELKLDIQDLKSMYRQQIDSLMSGQR